MIKFRDIGTLKNATNIGYCTTTVPLKNGYGVTVDESTQTVSLPTADSAKGDIFLVLNKIDKPEIHSPNEYIIEAGEHPRCFRIKSLDGRILDMDTDAITTAYRDIVVKDKLAFGEDGKLIKISDATGYFSYFEVIEKTTFGGDGIAVKVIIC